MDESRLERLEARVLQDLEYINIPLKSWVPACLNSSGSSIADVAIVGAGQSGLVVASALMFEGIKNIQVFDSAQSGYEGTWINSARMETLRSPKALPGLAHGIPSLTFRSWYEAAYGYDSWNRMDKIPTKTWWHYLNWYRKVLKIPVKNGVTVLKIKSTFNKVIQIKTEKNGLIEEFFTRKIVLTNGRTGFGGAKVPPQVKVLPKNLWKHSSEPISAKDIKSKDVVVIGSGASAMDNAIYSSMQGAKSVCILIRRLELSSINKLHSLLNLGFVNGFYHTPAEYRYNVTSVIDQSQVPPTKESIDKIKKDPKITLNYGCILRKTKMNNGIIEIFTDAGLFKSNFIITATGFKVDAINVELIEEFRDHILLWKDILPNIKNEYENHPFLGNAFELLDRTNKDNYFLNNIHCFNHSATLSHGEISSTILYISEGARRLARKIACCFFNEQKAYFMDLLHQYNVSEFD